MRNMLNLYDAIKIHTSSALHQHQRRILNLTLILLHLFLQVIIGTVRGETQQRRTDHRSLSFDFWEREPEVEWTFLLHDQVWCNE